MYTLKVKLKQHTPLIHFQHDQDGATLRASEVKPKLDKFILKRLGGGDYEKGKEEAKTKGWLVGKGDHPALDYKMRIEAKDVEKWTINERQPFTKKHAIKGKPFVQEGQNKYLAKRRKADNKLICDLKQYPLFFANMDSDFYDSNECRKFSFTEEPLVLVLIVSKDNLFDYINDADLLNDFFFQTNFGTRQSKGFGSFSIDKNDSNYRARSSKYRFTIDTSSWDDVKYVDDEYKRMFEYVDLFYKTLRGGINLKNGKGETLFYFKSLAYIFADESLNAKWDKRKVKEEFYGIERQTKSHTYDVRDMLGFSTNEQWLSYHDSIEKKTSVWDEEEKRFREPRRQEKPIADRMSSPILIKPLYDEDRCIYTINILFQDEKVNMASFKESQKVYISSRKNHRSFGIDIPQEFSTSSFFDFIFNEMDFDISSHVNEDYQDHEYYEILEDIYIQIKNNLKSL